MLRNIARRKVTLKCVVIIVCFIFVNVAINKWNHPSHHQVSLPGVTKPEPASGTQIVKLTLSSFPAIDAGNISNGAVDISEIPGDVQVAEINFIYHNKTYSLPFYGSLEKYRKPISHFKSHEFTRLFQLATYAFKGQYNIKFSAAKAEYVQDDNSGDHSKLAPFEKHAKPLDVDSIKFIALPQKVCMSEKKPRYMWYIYTEPKSVSRRDLIRKFWMQSGVLPDGFAELMFVIGRQKNASVGFQTTFEREIHTHNDILLVDFVESYTNLTYKAVAALKFAANYCKGVNYMIKMDDDVVVNIRGLDTLISRYSPQSHGIVGGFFFNFSIIRNPFSEESKFFLNPVEFPIRHPDTFPAYASGTVFAVTYSLFNKLYEQVPKKPWIWLDDAYVTGILGEGIPNVQRTTVYGTPGYRQSISLLKSNKWHVQGNHIIHYDIKDEGQYREVTSELVTKLLRYV